MGVCGSRGHMRDTVAGLGNDYVRTDCRALSSRVRFFVAGDIGEEGSGRRAVAEAMRRLQETWASNNELQASFVVGTGDQVYHGATDAAFDSLERDALDCLPLPWVLCLGNHDANHGWAGWHWHRNRHGSVGASGYRWICPAPAFSLDHIEPTLGGPVDLVVINTNKYNKTMTLAPPDKDAEPGQYLNAAGELGPAFYRSRNSLWWREQKRCLEEYLGGPCAQDGGRWRIVVGHHPAEYAMQTGWKEWAEHSIPIWSYLSTTFMRGGVAARARRWGLMHILRRNADLYICGHQHLMAHMTLRASRKRCNEDTRCQFMVVGCSSKTEQDEDDFDDGSHEANLYTSRDQADVTEHQLRSDGEPSTGEPSLPQQVGLLRTDRKRYTHEWVCEGRLGFAVVTASSCHAVEGARLRLMYYHVVGGDAHLAHTVEVP